MEFETNPTSPTDAAARLAASTKRVTIAPLHSDITSDTNTLPPRQDVPASIMVSNPNVMIPSESEDTSADAHGTNF